MDRSEQQSIPSHVPRELVVGFDVYNPSSDAESFHQACVEFQRSTPAPLVWSPHHGGHWIAVRGQDVFDLYADHERFSSKHYFIPAAAEPLPMGAFTLDPPEHGPFRDYLHKGLSPRTVNAEADFVRRLAIELSAQLAPRGQCEFIGDFADVLPLTVFLDLVDLPFEDRAKLGHWAEIGTRAPLAEERMAALENIAGYLQPYIEARRDNPGEDLLSRAVNSDINGRPMTGMEATGASIHLMGAGLDTVSSLFSFVMLFLARNPERRRELLDDPSLIPNATLELIRRFPVVTMVRMARADFEYKGVALKQGDMIAIPTAFYNLDDSIYPNPLDVDWHREVRKVLTFGNGTHRCPGSLLGRAELSIMLQEWLPRIPDFSVPPDADIPVAGGTVAKILNLPLRWQPDNAEV